VRRRLAAYLRSIDPRLPRSVWILNGGGLANALGVGIAYPFVAIYLHNVRGFSLGTTGFILAAMGGVGLLVGPLIGIVVDRIGGRATLAGALVLMAIGYAAFPLIRVPWHALLASAVVGIGNSGFWPSQSSLLAGLAPQARRHGAFALQRVTRNLGIGLGGLIGGLIATTANPTSFTILFLVDAVTFLVFVLVLGFVPDPEIAAEEGPVRGGGYLDVLRNRVFLGFVGLNVAFVSAGYAVFELLPVFAKNAAGVNEKAIGVIFFVNTIVIVVAQLPVAKLLEGRRRMKALAFMTALWALAWVVVLAGGAWFEAVTAAVVFAVAGILFGLGECFQGPVQGALVADLAPPRLRGRYMAISTNSWDLGFLLGPAVGGVVLATAPLALWPLAAAVCLLAGVGALALERSLPPRLRLTPA
jgi:predicted MFS family arabinose efflux permease